MIWVRKKRAKRSYREEVFRGRRRSTAREAGRASLTQDSPRARTHGRTHTKATERPRHHPNARRASHDDDDDSDGVRDGDRGGRPVGSSRDGAHGLVWHPANERLDNEVRMPAIEPATEPATELPMSKLAIDDDDQFVVWSEVAKRLLPGDHFAFAMTSKAHRRAVKNHLGPKKPITTSLVYWQRNPENYQYTEDWLRWIVNTSTISEGIRPPSIRHTKSARIDGELCSDDEICSEEMPKSGRELYLEDVIYIAGFRGFFDAMLSLITKQGTPRHTGDPFLSSPLADPFVLLLFFLQAPPYR